MNDKKRILFVCLENSNRSQIAEAFARIYGGEKVEVYSAGSRPSGKINPKAIESMRELGYDLSRHRSKSLTEIPDVQYDFVATMGCGDECPFVRAKARADWNIPDPKDLPPHEYRTVRDSIESKVKALLEHLS
jgi:arsenate reductase